MPVRRRRSAGPVGTSETAAVHRTTGFSLRCIVADDDASLTKESGGRGETRLSTGSSDQPAGRQALRSGVSRMRRPTPLTRRPPALPTCRARIPWRRHSCTHTNKRNATTFVRTRTHNQPPSPHRTQYAQAAARRPRVIPRETAEFVRRAFCLSM